MRFRALIPILILALAALACDSSSGGSDRRQAAATPFASAPVQAGASGALTPSGTTSASAAPSSATPTASPAASATPTPAATSAGLSSGERALAHVKKLAGEIGPRPAGSAADHAAAEYISGELRRDGLDVALQRVPVKTFVSRRAELRVLSPVEQTVRIAPLNNSPSGSASGDLFFAGLGLPSDYPAGGIGGRIALIARGQLTMAEKLQNAGAAGASAMIVFDPPNDVIPATIAGNVPQIPGMTIPGADGVRLRDMLKSQTVRVSLVFEGGMEDHEFVNVVGRPPGKGCAVVVGGHYDSVEVAPGASDNASGTAVMMEIARLQGERGNPEQACFVAFGGEELGLVGSQYFVDHLSDGERRAVRFMLNFDMEAVGDEWLFIGSPSLQQQAEQLASAAGVPGHRGDLVGARSDHDSFISRKIPALMLHRFNDQLLHTPQDTVNRITAPPLDAAVHLGMAFLSGLSVN